MRRVEYSSNNSGGSWWLKDKDWKSLEKGGWTVAWIRNEPFYGGETRWHGALAKEASKEFDEPALANAVKDWERLIGQDASARGCDCCGPPHSFSTNDGEREYGSGPELAFLLDEDEPTQLRRLARAALT